MRVLVTGGAGFIGSHIVERLLAKGYQAAVLDDLSVGRLSNLPEEIIFKHKSIIDISREDVESFDIIVHCAAQVSAFKSVDYPEEDFLKNALGTFKLLEAIRKHNPQVLFIYTSSRSVHGNIPEPHMADESWPYNPSTLYNVHKIYGEMLCKIYHELYGIRYVILRPSNVYGPRQPYWVRGWYNFISYWIRLALENKPIPIFGSGDQIRDYVYVTDIADAYLSAIKKESAIGETFLLCTGRGVSLNELADAVIKLTGSSAGKEYHLPRKGDIMRFVGSYEKANRLLGWKPRVYLEEGLRKEVEWVLGEPVR